MTFPLPLPLQGERVRLEEHDGQAVIIRLSDGVVAGALDVEQQGDALFVHSLCIEEPYRGFGLGSDTARVLREAAERGPWRVLRAWAPPDRGLAVYFWSRMGLRPLFGDGPEGGIAFERQLAEHAPAG